MSTFARDPSCDACRRITSGDCGRHGPLTLAATPSPAIPEADERDSESRIGHNHGDQECDPSEEAAMRQFEAEAMLAADIAGALPKSLYTEVRAHKIEGFSRAMADALYDKGYRRRAVTLTADSLPIRVARERVAALPQWDKRSVPGGFHVNRAAVLDILAGVADDEDRRAAIPEAGLDRELLARAMCLANGDTAEQAEKFYDREMDEADRIATEYERLRAEPAETDRASEYGRLLAERDRLIGEGVDPADLDLPNEPSR